MLRTGGGGASGWLQELLQPGHSITGGLHFAMIRAAVAVRVRVGGGDELASLADDVNALSASLREQTPHDDMYF